MHEFRVRPPAPFSFEKTAAFLSPGADDLVDVFDGKRYTRLLDLNGRLRLALVSSLGTEQRPELIVTLMNGSERDEPNVTSVLSHLLGFEFEPDSFYKMCRQDQLLFSLSKDHFGLKPPRRAHPFEAIALSVISGKEGEHFFRASAAPIAEEHSYKVAYAGDTFYAFPGPKLLAGENPSVLSKGGVDPEVCEILHAIAQGVIHGELDLVALARLPTSELMDELATIRGVGRLGAQLSALIGYGRLDCFPGADPLLRAWVAHNYYETEEVDEETVEEWAAQWGPLRGLVALHIYVDLREDEAL